MDSKQTKALLFKYGALIGRIVTGGPVTFEVWVPDPKKDGHGKYQAPTDFNWTKTDWKQEVGWALGKYRVRQGQTDIASWELYQLPHCCGIIVFCRAETRTQFRGQGIGKILNNLRMDIGRALGYSLALCTDLVTNAPQQKVLRANGWKQLHTFLNQRTRNQLHISVIGL